MVHVSQVGYHPAQRKLAVIELDPAETAARRATLVRIVSYQSSTETPQALLSLAQAISAKL